MRDGPLFILIAVVIIVAFFLLETHLSTVPPGSPASKASLPGSTCAGTYGCVG